MTSFDLSEVCSLHYRGQLRTAHWLVGGFFFVLLAVVGYRVAALGLMSWPLWTYGVIAVLEGFLLWVAFFYAIPGPVRLTVSEGSVTLSYRSGRERRIAIQKRRMGLRLVEQVDPVRPPRLRVAEDSHHFAVVGSDWVALTPEAYSALVSDFSRRGFVARTSMKPHPPWGAWRIQEFEPPVTG
jgi:hypothetical protein